MLIGNHFGKRKPQWNFFIKKYETFKYGVSLQLIKMMSVGLLIQTVLMAPVVYWIYQNYSIIEQNLPPQYHLQENIQFEKKWIAFLILGSVIAQSSWNYLIWRNFVNSKPFSIQNSSTSAMESPQLSSVKSASPVEADYPRRAS